MVNNEGKEENDTDDRIYFFKKLLINIYQNFFLYINTIDKLFLI